MQGGEQLKQLQLWCTTDMPFLVQAYRDHYINGTTGVDSGMKDKPAILNEHGVLTPERFKQYVSKLQSDVIEALRNNQGLRIRQADKTLPILVATLEQMIGSENLPEGEYEGSGKSLAELFEGGKQAGRTIREYLREADREGYLAWSSADTAHFKR